MLFLNGVPLFFLELAIGQWYSSGVIGVWKSICPLMKGTMLLNVKGQNTGPPLVLRPVLVAQSAGKLHAPGDQTSWCREGGWGVGTVIVWGLCPECGKTQAQGRLSDGAEEGNGRLEVIVGTKIRN